MAEPERNGPTRGPELIRRLGVSEEDAGRAVWNLIDSGGIELDWIVEVTLSDQLSVANVDRVTGKTNG